MKILTIGGKWLDDLNADMSGSDRSCAVLAGAILDDRLLDLLSNYLLPPTKKSEDKLLGRGGGVESFTARIELAKRLNLITVPLAKSLDWVRQVRNDAAHNADFSFGGRSVQSKVNNIIVTLGLSKRAAALLKPPYSGTKGNFVASIVLLSAFLQIESAETKRTSYLPANVLENISIKDG